MYLLLLAFGFVLTVAGAILAASGVSLHDSFDASLVTPGVVAAVGGLLLAGLGLALRVLNRIEKALAARPIAAVRPGEAAADTGRVAMPSRPLARVQTSAAPPAAPPTGEKRTGALAEALMAAEAEVPQSAPEVSPGPVPVPPAAASADGAAATLDRIRARRRNGAGQARVAPRLDTSPRVSGPAERPAGPAFDTLWPKISRPVPASPVATPSIPETIAPVEEPEQRSEPAPEVPAPVSTLATIEEVTVLKSGVVDGMAYTLFSDGSIEAQLPQGTLRFGSIAELRNHIEQSA